MNVSLAVVANLIMADENRKEAGKELTKLYTNSTLASTQLGSVGVSNQ